MMTAMETAMAVVFLAVLVLDVTLNVPFPLEAVSLGTAPPVIVFPSPSLEFFVPLAVVEAACATVSVGSPSTAYSGCGIRVVENEKEDREVVVTGMKVVLPLALTEVMVDTRVLELTVKVWKVFTAPAFPLAAMFEDGRID